MRIPVLWLLLATLTSSAPVYAGCGDAQSYLSQTQMSAVLSSNFACGRSTSDPPGWNERHLAGGSLQEQHEGGSTVETVGTWTLSTQANRGRVTYAYSGGISPVYEVAVVSGPCGNLASCTTLPQTYQFCGVGGGAPAVLNIYVSTAFQAPTGPPWVMNTNCPANP